MKKIFKNSFMALAVLALGFSACTEQVEYMPAEVPANEQVFFSNTNGTTVELLKEDTTLSISVKRHVAGGELTVPVLFTGDSLAQALCIAPDFVKFDSAATETEYVISLPALAAFVDGEDGSGSGYDKEFKITVAIDDTLNMYTTPYGDSKFTFTALVPAPWTDWAAIEKHETGIYTCGLLGECIDTVFYRQHMLDETRGQFLVRTSVAFANYGASDIVIDYNTETHACMIEPVFMANSSNGPIYLSDYPHNPFDTDGDGARDTYENFPCSYDPETGLFTLNVICFTYTGYAYFMGADYLQLDGFTQYDYSFDMQHKGNYVDNNGVNNAVIYAVKGADVSQYLMTVVSADEDANAAVQGMLAGTVPCDTLTESGYYAYPMTESGAYKALAITFDANGEPYEAHSTNFEFWVAGDSNPWESLGYAVYTDDLVLPLFGNPAMSYYVEVLENKEQPGMFRLVDLYGPEHPLYPYSTYEESYIEIDATDPDGVWFEGIQSTGMDVSSNGVMSLMSIGWYQVQTNEGATKEDAKAAGLLGVYADGVITFPVDGVAVVLGNEMFYEQVTTGFRLDMTNLLDEIPTEEGGESAAPAARMMMEIKAEAAGKVTRFKKIDNSYLVPVEMPMAW